MKADFFPEHKKQLEQGDLLIFHTSKSALNFFKFSLNLNNHSFCLKDISGEAHET